VCAAVARVDGAVTWARLGLGSVGGTPLRATGAEALLLGSAGGAEVIEEAAESAARECEPASDSHASERYRRELVAVLVRRSLTRAFGAAA
jgi:carbon-monoxide dehydrogenase medium subunit